MTKETPVLSHDPEEAARIEIRLQKIEQEQARLEKEHPNIPFVRLFHRTIGLAIADRFTKEEKEAYMQWDRLELERVRLSTPVM
jgi:hypothetical protein